MQVFFCDKCSRRVTEGELADGEGVRVGSFTFCGACRGRPEVQEILERADEMMEAGRASDSGLHRLVRESRNGRRRTPHHGRRRVKAKTPPPAQPRPLRPVSPPRLLKKLPDGVRSNGGRSNGGHRTPHRLRKAALPRKGGGRLALYGVVGIAVGFAIVAAAPALTNRPRAGSRPTRGTREVSIRWAGPEATADGGVRFEGKCTLARAEGRGSPQALCWVGFPSGGPWSVRVNGRVAYHGVALDGSRAKVGRAAGWLGPGANRIVATCGSGGVENATLRSSSLRSTSPPRLFVGRGR